MSGQPRRGRRGLYSVGGTARGQDCGLIAMLLARTDGLRMEMPGRAIRLGVFVGLLEGAAVTLLLPTLNGIPKPF